MKYPKTWIAVIFMLIGTVGITTSCTTKTAQNTNDTTSLEAKAFSAQSAANKDAVILDVRTPDEYVGGHIHNALNIDYNAADFKVNASKLPKEKVVYIYCRSGARSASAATIMRADGYNVIELEGGIMKWEGAGLPVETGPYVEPASSGMNEDQFNTLLNTSKLVLVDFNAAWCGPCKRMEPSLNQLSSEMASSLDIVRIDVDDNPTIASIKGIEALPTLHAYKNGKLIWQSVGYMSKADLHNKLRTL